MRVPVWLTLGIALAAFLFGAYRIRLGLRSDDADPQARSARGLHAMGRRTHVLMGIVYLLLGGLLIAMSFGWNPVGGMFGPATSAPTKDTAPTRTGVPVDHLPQNK
jgi:hypothetical protein